MNRNSPPRLRRGLAACILSVLCFLPLSSCTAITGAATGALTGFFDLPATLVNADENQADDSDFMAASLILAPVGAVLGPVMGFLKGLALDYTWVTGRTTMGDIYASTNRSSVWRPYAWEWMSEERGK